MCSRLQLSEVLHPPAYFWGQHGHGKIWETGLLSNQSHKAKQTLQCDFVCFRFQQKDKVEELAKCSPLVDPSYHCTTNSDAILPDCCTLQGSLVDKKKKNSGCTEQNYYETALARMAFLQRCFHWVHYWLVRSWWRRVWRYSSEHTQHSEQCVRLVGICSWIKSSFKNDLKY